MKLKQKNGHQNQDLDQSLHFLQEKTDKKKKLNFEIRESKLKKFKSATTNNGTTMTKCFHKWIDEYLEQHNKL